MPSQYPNLDVEWKKAERVSKKERPKPPPPYSIRFNDIQREQLKDDANGRPVAQYIRSLLFENDGSLRKGKHRSISDAQLLAQALGRLGESGLSDNLQVLAKAAHVGALPVTPETTEDLDKACKHVQEIRLLLIKALGLRP